jgi:hypothetical protein
MWGECGAAAIEGALNQRRSTSKSEHEFALARPLGAHVIPHGERERGAGGVVLADLKLPPSQRVVESPDGEQKFQRGRRGGEPDLLACGPPTIVAAMASVFPQVVSLPLDTRAGSGGDTHHELGENERNAEPHDHAWVVEVGLYFLGRRTAASDKRLVEPKGRKTRDCGKAAARSSAGGRR